MLIAAVLPLLNRPPMAEAAERKVFEVERSFILVAEERFVDNGDGTVTDTRRNVMWQKGDNGKEVTFEEAGEYGKTLLLGGYADWRLPKPDERETAVIIALVLPRHTRDARYPWSNCLSIEQAPIHHDGHLCCSGSHIHYLRRLS